MGRSSINELENGLKRYPRLETLESIAAALRVTLADLLAETSPPLPSITERPRLKRIAEALDHFPDDALAKVATHVDWIGSLLTPTGEAAAASVVVAFPIPDNPERTSAPQWTAEFPIEPSEFIETDFDYPRILHSLEVRQSEMAAGPTGAGDQMDTAFTLNAREVWDETHRVVKVKGDSMYPAYQNGWKVIVDLKKREPKDGDPVAVYMLDEGSILGYWKRTPFGVKLLKHNKSFNTVILGGVDEGRWILIGTVQKIADAPAPRMDVEGDEE